MATTRAIGSPLVIEVLSPNLSGSGLPRAVGDARRGRGPGPSDIGSDDAFRLLQMLDRLREEFDRRVAVHLIEPLSLAWLVRVLRHRPRRYPAFVIAGRVAVAGLDEAALRRAVSSALRRPPTR
jgi:hypothetical protein